MIFCETSELKPLLKRLAPLLSPVAKFKRNDIARHWIFEGSNWIAWETYEATSRELLGFALTSVDYDRASIVLIENVLSSMLRLHPITWTTIEERAWGEECTSKKYDCGYETLHQFGRDLLKITIQHKGTYHDRRPSAIAVIKRAGSNGWKFVCDLKGQQIRSRDEMEFREGWGSFGRKPNSSLFQQDEQDLFQKAIRTLTM